MIKRFCLFFCVIISYLLGSIFGYNASLALNIGKNAKSSVEPFPIDCPIVDGQTYFIKPYLDLNKSLDIPNSNYASGTNPIMYDALGWNNQRFIVEKSFSDYYRIRPIDANNLYLAIEYYEPLTQSLLLVDNYNYDYYRIVSSNFKFEYNTYLDCYLISTMVSNCTKYLHPINNSFTNLNQIEQAEIDVTNISYFYWKLIPTNNINVNCSYDVMCGSYQSRSFYFDATYASLYTFELTHSTFANLKLSLLQDNSNHTLISSAYTSYSTNQYSCSLNLSLNRTEIIEVRVSNYSSYIITARLKVFPTNQVMISTMYDYGVNNIDSISTFVDSFPYIESLGYYPLMQINMNSTHFTNENINGTAFINSKMYFAIEHGNPGGVNYYEGLQASNWIDIVNMPNLDSCQLAFWGCCNSDVLSVNHNNSGISSSIARRAVEKGAIYSIGFRDYVCSFCIRDFAKNFIFNYSENGNIYTSALLAEEAAINNNYCVSCLVYPGVKKGSLYQKNQNAILRYNLTNGNLMGDLLDNNENQDFEIDYHFVNSVKYLKYNDIFTNLTYTSSNFNYMSLLFNNLKEKFIYNPNIFIRLKDNNYFFSFNGTRTSIYECLNGVEWNVASVSQLFKDSLVL